MTDELRRGKQVRVELSPSLHFGFRKRLYIAPHERSRDLQIIGSHTHHDVYMIFHARVTCVTFTLVSRYSCVTFALDIDEIHVPQKSYPRVPALSFYLYAE